MKRFIYTIFTAALLFTFSACEVGLGEAVDLKPPRVILTSPSDNDTKPYLFTLVGNVSDNKDIDRIEIDFGEANIFYLWEGGSLWKKNTPATGGLWVVMDSNFARLQNKTKDSFSYRITVDLNEADEAYINTNRTFTVTVNAYDSMGNTGKSSKVECSFTIDINDPNVTVSEPTLLLGTIDEAKSITDSYELKDAATLSKLYNGDFVIRGHQSGSTVFKELRIEFDGDEEFGTRNDFDEDWRYSTDDGTIDDSAEDLTTERIADVPDFKLGAATTTPYLVRTIRLKDANGNYEKDDAGETITDLRNWWIKVKQDDLIYGKEGITEAEKATATKKNPELESGRHLIRIVSTSISSSGAWERRVLGYFVWWPESDNPWVEASNLDSVDLAKEKKAQVYPGSNITGNAYDDDGVKSITYTITKKDGAIYSTGEELTIENDSGSLDDDGNPTYTSPFAFILPAPGDEGEYRIKLKAKDSNDIESDETVAYFKVMDISAPKLSVRIKSTDNKVIYSDFLTSSGKKEAATGSLMDLAGDSTLVITGEASDDSEVKEIKCVWLDPSLTGKAAANNLVNYMSSNYDGWKGKVTDTNRIISPIPLTQISASGEEASGDKKYTFEKRVRLDELGIDGVKMPFGVQQFVFFAEDGGGQYSIPELVSISGDREKPSITLDSITIGGVTTNFNPSNPPTFEKFTQATINGKWRDNSTKLTYLWKTPEKQFKITNWGRADTTSAVITPVMTGPDSDGYYKWSATFSNIPESPNTSITVSLTDFALNQATDTKTYQMDSSELSWSSVGTAESTSDGFYKAGDVLEITTVFSSRKVHFSGGANPPRLKLNITNGGVAQYATYKTVGGGNDDKDGNNIIGSNAHIYTYTVRAGDMIANDGKLNVEAIEKNGNTWRDNKINKTVPMNAPPDGSNLGDLRDIRIDTVAPRIKDITSATSAGYYKEGSTILISLNFSEQISATSESALSLKLSGISAPVTECYANGNSVIFLYTVEAGDNASPLTVQSFSIGSGESIIDTAQNAYSGAISTTPLSGIVVDTTPPTAPVVTVTHGASTLTSGAATASVMFLDTNATFSITGESGGTLYYNLAESEEELSYQGGTIALDKNGTYKIVGRQYDRAGNVSPWSKALTVKVDNGALLSKITADRSDGTYGTGETIKVRLTFRKEVTIGSGATLTLNAKTSASGTTYCQAALSTTVQPNTVEEFTYTVGATDVISSGKFLNVTALNLGRVTCDGETAQVSLSDVEGNNLIDNKEIQIKSGVPVITGTEILCANGSEIATLVITFDRNVRKLAGDITLKQKTGYRAPIGMTVQEYESLISATSAAAVNNVYDKTTYGANRDSSGTLTFDTSTKYLLKYALNAADTTGAYYTLSQTLANKEGYGKVTIPMYASDVKVKNNTLTVELSGAYKLPTLGADYEVTIDGGIVSDEDTPSVNAEKSYTGSNSIRANGVAKPVIRVNKGTGRSESISGGSATQQLTTEVKIDTRTPGATIKYGKNEKESSQSTFIGGADGKPNSTEITATAGATAPTSIFSVYSGVIRIGSATTDQSSARAATSQARAGSQIIIHAKGWNRIHYWGGDCGASTWPGVAMTSEGNDWNKITLTGTNTSLLFNYQNNENWKTANLTRDSAGEYWFVGNTSQSGQGGTWTTSNPDGTPTPPTPTPGPSTPGSGVTGLKVALAAQAVMGSNLSAVSYEYVCRSVLYLEIADGDKRGYQNNIDNLRFPGDSTNTARSSLSMWVAGGDSDSGENGVVGFPLSWQPNNWNAANKGGVHLMTGGFSAPLNGTWYYVTWELTTPACVGFLLGNVPSDAAASGPSKWVWATCAWTAYKSLYRLYPGEKLWLKSNYQSRFTGMKAENGTVNSNVSHGSLEFEKDNTGHR